MKTLHIVNGDSTLHMLKDAGIEAPILPWRDVLHDGRVVSLNNPDYAAIRADHLSQFICSVDDQINQQEEFNRIKKDINHRAQTLQTLAEYEEVILWFEHDLYDQLQLIEALTHPSLIQHNNISLVSIDSHPDVRFFHGFGNLTPQLLLTLMDDRVSVCKEFKAAAKDFWHHFLSADPNNMLSENSLAQYMPFWPKAQLRYFGEFPDSVDGLTQTQRLLMRAVAEPATELRYLRYCLGLDAENKSSEAVAAYNKGLMSPSIFKRLFWQLQDMEAAPFMGDLGIKKELNNLATAPVPLLSTYQEQGEDVYQLTSAGANILAGNSHWLDYNDYDFYRGGVHINMETPWQWDSAKQSFVR